MVDKEIANYYPAEPGSEYFRALKLQSRPFSEWGKYIAVPPALKELYAPHEGKARGLFDPVATSHPGYNFNQHAAQREIMAEIYGAQKKQEGLLVGVLGPMGGGKTAVLYLLAEAFKKENETVFPLYHKFDRERTGGEDVILTHGNGKELEATSYETASDLRRMLSELKRGTIVLIDEYQFIKESDDFQTEELKKLIKELGLQVVFGSLDTDFKREIWLEAGRLVQAADSVCVLTARCSHLDYCDIPATLTQLNVDGKPASRELDVVQIGKVTKKMFAPMCGGHHRLEEDLA